MRIPSFTRAAVGGTSAMVLLIVVVILSSRSAVDRSEIASSGPTHQVEGRSVSGVQAVPIVDDVAPHNVTLEFIGDEIELTYFFSKERRGYAKGERIRPGRISHLTGWTYPDLLDVGTGNHTIIDRRDELSKAQRYTLRIDPSSVYCVF